MPMMMHHDTQPLYSRLANTTASSIKSKSSIKRPPSPSRSSLMTPSPGTKLYEGTFTSGLVLESVGAPPRVGPTCTRRQLRRRLQNTHALGKNNSTSSPAYLRSLQPPLGRREPRQTQRQNRHQTRRHATRRHVRPRPLHPPHLPGWGLRLLVPRKSTPPLRPAPILHPHAIPPPAPAPSHAPAPLELTISASPHRRRGRPLTPPA